MGTAVSLTSRPAQSWISRLLSLSYLTGLSWHKLLGAAVCAGVALHAGAWISHWAGPPSTRPVRPSGSILPRLGDSHFGRARAELCRAALAVRGSLGVCVRLNDSECGTTAGSLWSGNAPATLARARTCSHAHALTRTHAYTLAVLWRRSTSAVPLRSIPAFRRIPTSACFPLAAVTRSGAFPLRCRERRRAALARPLVAAAHPPRVLRRFLRRALSQRLPT